MQSSHAVRIVGRCTHLRERCAHLCTPELRDHLPRCPHAACPAPHPADPGPRLIGTSRCCPLNSQEMQCQLGLLHGAWRPVDLTISRQLPTKDVAFLVNMLAKRFWLYYLQVTMKKQVQQPVAPDLPTPPAQVRHSKRVGQYIMYIQ